jgi:hypothetical protein
MLSNNALLVYLSISRWTGRKQDRKANETVKNAHDVKARDAVNTTKALLPTSSELKAVNHVAGQIRTFFYENTVPWQHGGMFMIRSTQFMDFMQEFNALKTKFETAVNDFVEVYPQLREAAKSQLGTLFNELDYPHPDLIKSAYGCHVQVFPVPDVGDFRIDLGDAEKQAFMDNLRQVEANATRTAWAELHEVVKNAAEKLSQPDAIFRDTLISNITEMCRILPRLNIMDDPTLEAARVEVEQIANKLSPDVCRDNATEREQAATKLKQLTEKMGAFMGGE